MTPILPTHMECPYCGKKMMVRPFVAFLRNRKVWISIAAVVILSLVVLGFSYRRFILSGWDLVGEATGGRTSALIALLFALLALVFVVIWMLFPIFVYLGLRNLGRRTAELDRTARLCAVHLAQLIADRDASATRPATTLKAPDENLPSVAQKPHNPDI